MKKLMMTIAGLATVGLVACGQPRLEEQFFGSLERAVSDMERMTDQDTVCMSQMVEITERQDTELMPLAEQMEAKHGAELPAEYEQRMQQLSERMQVMMVELMPKMDLDC